MTSVIEPLPKFLEGGAGEPRDPLKRVWSDGHGLRAWFSTVQNGPIVYRFMTTVFAFFLLGGVEALLMRTQLAVPENTALSPDLYNQLFTMHGSTMMFLFAVPMMEAFAEFLLPPMLGSRELPFPRMTAFLFWVVLFGGLLFNMAFVVGQLPDSGWFAYTPLSNIRFSPSLGVDFWLLGLDVAQIGAVGDVFELAVGILRMRAPGMSLAKMPLYLWSILVMAFMMLFAFTPLFMCTLMLQLDRHWGTHFFDPAAGGDPLLWQHLFWIFGHPEVYIMFIPATGMMAMIVPTFARRPIVGHRLVILAMVATGFISFGLWVHHMFTAGLPLLGMSFFTAASLMIAIPSGIQIFSLIATLWTGHVHFRTPLLFALGFISVFVVGGLTGVMLAAVPFDWQVTDSYFVVAHFHYVLIGGLLFPTFAALYYWMPKLSGRLLNEKLGAINFAVMFIAFNVTFFPMHVSGLLGMPRRVYTYAPGLGLETPNLISTIGAFALGIGVLLFMVNVVYNVYLGHGQPPDENPWRAGSLEWATETPPGDEGWRVPPIVHSRLPLWEQERLDEGDPRWVQLAHALEHYPTHFRASLVTSLSDAIPQAIVRLPGPSILPMVAAIALMTVFAAELYNVHPLAIGAGIIMAGAIIGWMWPPKVERERRLADDGGPTIHGLPVYTSGPVAPAWWGMLFVLLVMAVGSACVIFGYYYLRVRAPEWPPLTTAKPGLVLPLANLVVLAALSGAMALALRSIKRGVTDRTLAALGGAAALAALFLVVQGVEFSTWGWTPDANAFTSAFGLLAGIQTTFVLLGLIMTAVVTIHALLGYFNHWRFLAIENLGNYWYFVTGHWVVLLVVLYLT